MKLKNEVITAVVNEAIAKEVITKKEVKALQEVLVSVFENLQVVKSGKGYTLATKESNNKLEVNYQRVNKLGTKQEVITKLSKLQNKISYALNKQLYKEVDKTKQNEINALINRIDNGEALTFNGFTYSKVNK